MARNAAGVDPDFRLNSLGLELVLEHLDKQGVLDHDKPRPPGPPGSIDPDDYEARDRAFEDSFRLWHAQQEQELERIARDGDLVRVPVVKFSSNDSWQVFPVECRAMADAARDIDAARAKALILDNEHEIAALKAESDPDEPDYDQAADNLYEKIAAFGRYCDAAATFGGFKVE